MKRPIDRLSELMGLVERCPLVKELYANPDAHSMIPAEYADALYATVLTQRPTRCVLIGLGFGAAALAMLTALDEIGVGELVSIDSDQMGGCATALEMIDRAGFADRHRFIREESQLALPRMVASGGSAGLVYIDGMHTFDYVLLDAWYADRLLPVGGVVVFNDASMPAIDRVIRWLRSHRRYKEMPVLEPKPVTVPLIHESFPIGRRLRRPSGRLWNDRYFRKLDVWQPAWDEYADF